ncbi:MAG: hypothetical protein AB7U20_11195 [Planctomycetaceae bacterium]
MVRVWIASLFVMAACWLTGCSGKKMPETVPTFPVSGTVHIDGKPTGAVRVMMYPAEKPPEFIDPNVGAPHQSVTDPAGKFQITTYFQGDGAPVGSYVVFFYWEGNPKVTPFAIPDEMPVDPVAARFNKKYANAVRPQQQATVEEGKPTDLGVLELTTK